MIYDQNTPRSVCQVQNQAIAELVALPPNHPFRDLALASLVEPLENALPGASCLIGLFEIDRDTDATFEKEWQ